MLVVVESNLLSKEWVLMVRSFMRHKDTLEEFGVCGHVLLGGFYS